MNVEHISNTVQPITSLEEKEKMFNVKVPRRDKLKFNVQPYCWILPVC